MGGINIVIWPWQLDDATFTRNSIGFPFAALCFTPTKESGSLKQSCVRSFDDSPS